MGVVNITPDSFSDGGRHFEPTRAIEHGLRLAEEGADILDIGGESTRPGAQPVGADEELRRLLPVLAGLSQAGKPVSVDTLKPEVMRAVLASGADMINDVAGFRVDGAFQAVARSRAAIVIMHMQGEPRTMQVDPQYADVVAEVCDYLAGRVRLAQDHGIDRGRIVIDPGFGFGKSQAHNLALLAGIGALTEGGVPVMVGLSRKSMLGRITGRDVDERVHASVAAALLAVERGASIVRVHDVRATIDALAVLAALKA